LYKKKLNGDEVVVDDDVEESNNGCHGNDFIFESIFEIKEGMFNLLVEEDYLDPCPYEKDGDDELDFNVNGDVDRQSTIILRIWIFMN
jgi:hypothetical protein